MTDPAASGRADFRQVVYPDRFKAAVARMNPGSDGQPWLGERQLDYLLRRLQGGALGHGASSREVAGNREAMDLLRRGLHSGSSVPGWRRGEDPPHVRLIDWAGKLPEGEGNDFLVVSRFRVDWAGDETADLDLVLFVNGLPWGVLQRRAMRGLGSRRGEGVGAAEQVVQYAGARSAAAVPEFVRFAQVLVAIDGDDASLGTVSSEAGDFVPWRTTEPVTEGQVRAEVGKTGKVSLTAQEVLVAGVLRPVHLLTLVRDFVETRGHDRSLTNVIGRYHQYRAVLRLAERLAQRRRQIAAGEPADNRGGTVQHVTGSGRNLTMALLVRHLRSTPGLDGHKVVVVTDRLASQDQLMDSLAASSEMINRARTLAQARALLAVDVPDVVLVMLQKFQGDDVEHGPADDEDSVGFVRGRVLNESSDIVVLIDAAHRGQTAWQHVRLRTMLPNAVFVGFTGAPISSDRVRATEDIFGATADLYTLRDAELDRAAVPVRYEGWNVPLEVIERASPGVEFVETLPTGPELRERELREFVSRTETLEWPSVIAAKADYVVEHWATTALPGRFGALILAGTRQAAVRWGEELPRAFDRLLIRLDGLKEDLRHDPLAHLHATEEETRLLDLVPHLRVLESAEAAVVMSGGRGDPREWFKWTAKSRRAEYFACFRRGLGDPYEAHPDPFLASKTRGVPSPDAARQRPGASGGDGPMAFLVGHSILLNGFDAPHTQVVYVDRPLSGIALSQAKALINRPYHNKRWGQMVDLVSGGTEAERPGTRIDDDRDAAGNPWADASERQAVMGAPTRNDDAVSGARNRAGGEDEGIDRRAERLVHEMLLEEMGVLEGESVRRAPHGVELHAVSRGLCDDIVPLVRSSDIIYLPDTRDFARSELRRCLVSRVGMEWRSTRPLAELLVSLAVAERDSFLRYGQRQSDGGG